MSVKVLQDIESVGSLGSGCQTEQDARPDVIEESLVARCSGVVELIDNNVLVAIDRQIVEGPALVALDRHEQVIELGRLAATDEEVTEVGVTQNVTKGPEALF
jgi:hypothetical protein